MKKASLATLIYLTPLSRIRSQPVLYWCHGLLNRNVSDIDALRGYRCHGLWGCVRNEQNIMVVVCWCLNRHHNVVWPSANCRFRAGHSWGLIWHQKQRPACRPFVQSGNTPCYEGGRYVYRVHRKPGILFRDIYSNQKFALGVAGFPGRS